MSLAGITKTNFVVIGFVFLAGCASIVEGTDQTIAINTDPTEAECTLTQDGKMVGTVNRTPGVVNLDKSKKDLIVECTKDGHFKEVSAISSSFEGMTFGNIIFGGIIGVGIDAASGAMHHYPEDVTVLLTPTSFDSEERRDKFFEDRREFIISEADRAEAKIRKDCLPDERNKCEDDIKEMQTALDEELKLIESRRTSAKIEGQS